MSQNRNDAAPLICWHWNNISSLFWIISNPIFHIMMNMDAKYIGWSKVTTNVTKVIKKYKSDKKKWPKSYKIFNKCYKSCNKSCNNPSTGMYMCEVRTTSSWNTVALCNMRVIGGFINTYSNNPVCHCHHDRDWRNPY